MGNGPSQNLKKPKTVVLSQRMNVGGCRSDLDCENPDAARSSPEAGLVLSCPGSKCIGSTDKSPGKCQCSETCKYDPYSGTCCQDIIDIRGDKFCIEYTEPPKQEFGFSFDAVCEMKDQYFTHPEHGTVKVPGKEICKWCAQSVTTEEKVTEAPVSTEGFASVDTLVRNFMY